MTDLAKVTDEEEASLDEMAAPKSASFSEGTKAVDGRTASSFTVPKGRKLSRMPSKSLSEQISNARGSFTINKEELAAVVRNIDRKEGKIRRGKQIAMACTFAVTFAAVETSKESHIGKTGMMTDLKGKAVSTKPVETFAKLWDLPKFDIHTLAEVKRLTLDFKDGNSGSYVITDARKERGSRTVTFSSGINKITIDSDAKLAVATIDGHKHIVDPNSKSSASRQLGEEAPAKLYETHDFFTKEAGFERDGSRKLADDSEMGGYAAVGLAAAEAILESFSVSHPDVSSVLLTGAIFQEDGSDSRAVKVFYDSDTKTRKVDLIDGDLRVVFDQTTGNKGAKFTYQNDKLQSCEQVPQSESEYAARIADLKAEIQEHSGDSFLVSTSGGLYFEGTAKFSANANEIALPTDEECMALVRLGGDGPEEPDDPKEEAPIDSGSGRRLGGGGRATSRELWQLAKHAYRGKALSTHLRNQGWRKWMTCSKDNAFAKFFWHPSKNVEVVAFAGTDGLGDIKNCFTGNGECDWKDNLKTGNDGGFHKGFKHYANKLKPCVDKWIKKNNGWGYTMSYVIGHSLGGAAASVYHQLTEDSEGNKYTPYFKYGAVTFGAPSTRYDNVDTCNVKGHRFFHIDDPVPSTFMGIMKANHDVALAYQTTTKTVCIYRPWYYFGFCKTERKTHTTKRLPRDECQHKSSTCSKQAGNWFTSFFRNAWELGGCALNFMGVHSEYQNINDITA